MGDVLDISIITAFFVSLFFFWRWVLGKKLANKNEVVPIAVLLAFVTGVAVLFTFIIIMMSGVGC